MFTLALSSTSKASNGFKLRGLFRTCRKMQSRIHSVPVRRCAQKRHGLMCATLCHSAFASVAVGVSDGRGGSVSAC